MQYHTTARKHNLDSNQKKKLIKMSLHQMDLCRHVIKYSTSVASIYVG